MKKNFFRGSLFFLLTLFFVSCGNVVTLSEDTTQLTFALGDEVAVAIASRQASTTGGNYRVVMSLAGDSSQTIEQSATEETLATVPFVFKDIPIGARVRVSCSVYYDGINWWSGSSDEIIVDASSNRSVINLTKHIGIVVWNGTSLGIRPYGTDITGSLPLQYTTGQNVLPAFAFDNDKNLYYVDTSNNYLHMLPYDNGKYSLQGTVLSMKVQATSLCYDQVTGKLYGYGGSGIYRYDFTTVGISETGIDLSNGDLAITPTAATVHNGRAYMYQVMDDGPHVIFGDLVGNEIVYDPDQNAIKINNLPSGATVTDMMVQDGALYLLIRHVDFNSVNAYSRGGIMKINLGETPTLDTSFGDNGVYGLTSTETTFEAGSTPITYIGGGTFLGPVKFVAVVPKKLVIADWGATVASGTEKATVSKKSRLVTVDLDTLSASVETVSELGDYYNYSEAINPTGSYFN